MPANSRVEVPARCFSAGETFSVSGTPVTLPDPGHGLGMHFVAPTGEVASADLRVENHSDTVTITRGESAVLAGGSTGGPAACSDSANSWSGTRNNDYGYYVNVNGLPSGVTATDFTNEVSLAATIIDTGGNDCGLATGSSRFTISIYQAGSTGSVAMRNDGSCYGDGIDTVDFGYLASSNIGFACTRYTIVPFADDVIYETDVRLLNRSIWFRYIPSGCSGRFEMASVLVHEFGHAMGASHVSESSHAQQTMSTASTPCSYADRSLGRGDYVLLDGHY